MCVRARTEVTANTKPTDLVLGAIRVLLILGSLRTFLLGPAGGNERKEIKVREEVGKYIFSLLLFPHRPAICGWERFRM